MIIYNKEKIDKIKNWKDDSIYILADFDRTITSSDSTPLWGVLAKSKLVSKEYINERQKLYDYYRKIELDEKIDRELKNKYMLEWFEKHLNLLVSYKISKQIFDEVSQNQGLMKFREGAQAFFKEMNERNIPIIIISAGIGNFINEFLRNNNCDFQNIHVISNTFTFENDILSKIEGEIVHIGNKDSIVLPKNIKQEIQNRHNIILLGDTIFDIRMAKENDRENALKIGFLDTNEKENLEVYKQNFDVVCTNNTSFTEILKELNI